MEFKKFDGGDLGTIYIPDEVDPQNWAMLAAWYSRSIETPETMLEKVSTEGRDKFFERFYVGYGHESLGDLVDIKMFIQGIPLYLAPLIEHYALFRGQESSTRYIDFSKQRLYGRDQEIMKAQIVEYVKALTFTTDKLFEINKPETELQKNAVKARAFDITRSLLPLGATTNVAWFGDIRSIKGHLAWMLEEHPWSAPWVEYIYETLKSCYPASMEKKLTDIRVRQPWVFDEIECVSEHGSTVTFEGNIDFGSWRDLNRHRVGRQTFHLPERDAGIDLWYLEMFELLGYKFNQAVFEDAYYSEDIGTLLLGQRVPFTYQMPESQSQYFIWRRNQMDVHPTLRLKVQDLAIRLGRTKEYIPDVGLGYIERRGGQTIFHKP